MSTLDLNAASRFAAAAIGHITREYPNKLDHVLTGPQDVLSPRALHPIFYGSFDWHSCVHGWWTLFTCYRLYPDLPEAHRIRADAEALFTEANVAVEVAYLKRPESRGFERPYGWAWLLMLQAELDRHESPEGRRCWVYSVSCLKRLTLNRRNSRWPSCTSPGDCIFPKATKLPSIRRTISSSTSETTRTSRSWMPMA